MFYLFQERRIIDIAIGIKQIHFVLCTLLGSLLQNASNRSYSDAAGEKYGGPAEVFVQCERSPGPTNNKLGAKAGALQCVFEDCLTHAHSDHDGLVFLRSVRQ